MQVFKFPADVPAAMKRPDVFRLPIRLSHDMSGTSLMESLYIHVDPRMNCGHFGGQRLKVKVSGV